MAKLLLLVQGVNIHRFKLREKISTLCIALCVRCQAHVAPAVIGTGVPEEGAQLR